jgi:hypothetical protein
VLGSQEPKFGRRDGEGGRKGGATGDAVVRAERLVSFGVLGFELLLTLEQSRLLKTVGCDMGLVFPLVSWWFGHGGGRTSFKRSDASLRRIFMFRMCVLTWCKIKMQQRACDS